MCPAIPGRVLDEYRDGRRAGVGIEIEEDAVPVRDGVRGACEILGPDPLPIANEGKLVAFVPEAEAEDVLTAMRSHPLGADTRRIGRALDTHAGRVLLRTPLGSTRVLEPAWGELLPRIC